MFAASLDKFSQAAFERRQTADVYVIRASRYLFSEKIREKGLGFSRGLQQIV